MAHRLIAGALAVATIAACASPAPPSLDGDALVAALPAAIVPADPDIVEAVTCPEPVPEVIAQDLVCEAAIASVAITVDVRVDAEGVAATEIREPLFDLDAAADEVAERLRADLGRRPTVVCPGTLIVLVVGASAECTATLDRRPIAVELELVDDAGTFALAVAEAQED